MHLSDQASKTEIIESIRKTYPVIKDMRLQFGDCCIKVNASAADIINQLQGYYSSFLTDDSSYQIEITLHEADPPNFVQTFCINPPEPGKTKIKEEYFNLDAGRVVRKRLTNMIFVFGEGENLAIGPCLNNLNQIINFINSQYIQWELCKGSILGHAAGVSRNSKGVAIAGFSGAGKSTLALHLMSMGTDFISNDRLMINFENDQLLMKGVAKHPRVNPGTILNNPNLIPILTESEKKEFESLSPEKLWHLEQKYDIQIEHFFKNSRFTLKSSMKVLIVLNWQRAEKKSVIKEVDLFKRRDLLPALAKTTGLFFLPPHTANCRINPSRETDYLELLQHCTVFEICGAVDFKKAAETVMKIMET